MPSRGSGGGGAGEHSISGRTSSKYQSWILVLTELCQTETAPSPLLVKTSRRLVMLGRVSGRLVSRVALILRLLDNRKLSLNSKTQRKVYWRGLSSLLKFLLPRL